MDYIKIIVVLLILHAVDIVAGIIAAIREHDLQSAKLRDGIFKKMGFILCYLLGYITDMYAPGIGLKIPLPVSPYLFGYVFLTEAVSIIENIGRVNPELLPDKLMEMFHVKRSSGGN